MLRNPYEMGDFVAALGCQPQGPHACCCLSAPQPASGPKKAPGREEVATLRPAAVRLGLAPGMRVPGEEGEQKGTHPRNSSALHMGLGARLYPFPFAPGYKRHELKSSLSFLLPFMPTTLQLSRGYNLAASGQIFTSSPGHTLCMKPSPRPSRRLLEVSCRKCSSFSSACSLHMAVLIWLTCSSPRKAQVVSLAKLKADDMRALLLEAAGCLHYR